MAFEPIESQEQLDAVLKTRLAREREKIKAEYADYDELAEKAKAYDKAQERIAQLEGDIKKRDEADKVREMRKKVAKETGIPEDLIQGTDEESMKAYAAQIAEFAKVQTPAGAPDPTPGSFSGSEDGASDDKRDFVRALFGKE